ncbi:bifunctional DNA-formamidopyrimidine glycosylase/DNA-(apurinic or apyrimidinic site) lyase [Candidatus Saccharibacteria bacterium]|nr:bifunctional DNA-formamidopyrimidine glycosylase/DNA-(apurinic or apyrimidinic site) lyase [Candidatus Saccharibacteria bacterium]
MPEGPEVETIRRGLELGIVGETIAGVEVLWQKSFDVPIVFTEQYVVGAQVTHLARRAKVLMIELSSGYTMLVHLKMTGQMVLVKRDGERFAGGHPSESTRSELPDRSSKVVFDFASGDKLFFNDFRKFGWIKLVLTSEVELDPLVARLGPEALSPEFTPEYFQSQLDRHKRAPIKPVILDQSTVGGIGNIYADESLHLARIHPQRLAGSLTKTESSRLHAAIREIIALGIEHGGTSFSRYVNALGGKGDYLEHARVFRRDGETCPVHPEIEIIKFKVAGRGTHICPKCQKLTAI